MQRYRWQGRLLAVCSMHAQRIVHKSPRVADPHPLRNPSGKGGLRHGYRYLTRNGQRIGEHRLVAAEMIGRPLRSDEHVHHRNGNKLDNRPDNLMVLSNQEHKLLHYRYGWSLHEFSLDALKELRTTLDSLIAKLGAH